MNPELFQQFLQQYYAQNPTSYFGSQAGSGGQGGGGGGSTLQSMMSTLQGGSPWGAVAGAALTGLSSLLGGKSAQEKALEWSTEQKKRLSSQFGNQLKTGGDVINNTSMLGMLDKYRTSQMPTNARIMSGMSRFGGIGSPELANMGYRQQLAPEAGYMQNLQEKNVAFTQQRDAQLRQLLAMLAG
ncbi:MAG: hypothetical protein WC356_03840 [Candidatus Micrarchaeia archaeon]|jgi:hypothetical protein